MSPTVHALRNQIRLAVGRYERVEQTQFTKESLAAIANAVGYEVDLDQKPSKAEMRAGIRWKLGRIETPDTEEGSSPLRKDELVELADRPEFQETAD